MAISIFKSFISTINPFRRAGIFATRAVLVDSTTGAPVGIQNDNANGPDGIWVPIDISAAQLASPSAAMLADLNATYRLNVAPYNRFQSTGTALSALTTSDDNVQQSNGLFGTIIAWSPLTISDPAGLSVLGTVSVRALSA